MKTAMTHQNLLLATAAQNRHADRQTIESFGIPGETLMEIAGGRATDLIMAELPRPATVLFVCGKGNNAGDALVIARLMLSAGYNVEIFPVLGSDGFSPDAQLNFDRLMRLARELNTGVAIWRRWQPASAIDLIVDGIFGTGLERQITAPVSEIVGEINRSGKPVCALDIPSGIHSDSGEVLGCAVRAVKTIQFGIRKLGCYLGNGPVHCGKRQLVNLPFPVTYMKDIRIRLMDITLQPFQFLTPPRVMESDANRALSHIKRHKYSNGVVNVVGGSAGLTGAPLYAARAAWSLGMGAVSLLYPAAWSTSMETLAPELIKKPIGDSDSQFFTEEHCDIVLDFLAEKEGVTVIGPGIGRHENTLAFVRKIVEESKGPLIIDADALRSIPGYERIIFEKERPEQIILTPHPGELAVLTGKKSETDHERLQVTAELFDKLGCLILSKGNPVIVHAPDEPQTLVTPYDTGLFSRAGFGDTLAGHIAAFLSRTGDPSASCEHALIYGFNKINEIKSAGKRFPEPSDLT